MDNATFAPVAQEPAKKSSNLKVVIVALIALLIGAGATAAVFLIMGNNRTQPNEQTASKTNASPSPIAQKEDGKESDVPTSGEITNARLVEELATKTNRILGNEESSKRNALLDTSGDIATYKNLSDDDKSMAIISKYYSLERSEPASNIPDGYEIKNSHLENGRNEAQVLDISETIVSDYHYLFGYDEEPVWAKEVGIDRVSYCPHYYVKERNYYVSSFGCGGWSASTTYGYQYKYSYDGNKAYVYIAIATVVAEGDDYTIYSGFYEGAEKKNLSKDDAYTLSYSLSYNFDEYYKDFAHYRVIFEKDSIGNYAYKTIEGVKD